MNKLILFSGILIVTLSVGAIASGMTQKSKSPKTPVNSESEEGFAGSYLASQYARRSGNFAAAIGYLQESHRKNPDNAELAKQLEGMFLLNGQVHEAMKVADSIYGQRNDEAISALLLSLRSLKKGDTDSAVSILKTSFKSTNGQLWLPLVSAWLDISQGTFSKPLNIKSIKSANGRAAMVVHYHLALINDMAGFEKAAAANFMEAAKSENPPFRVMQALLGFYGRSNKPEKLKPLVEAYLAQHPGFVYEDIGVHNPHDGIAEVLFTMGSIMLSANMTQDAAIYLRLALYLKPDFPMVQLTLADSYSDMKQYAIANKVYSQINPRHPLYSAAQINRALNRHRTGDIAGAIDLLNLLSKDKETRYHALVTKGDILRENLRFEDAIDAYSRAIKQVVKLDAQHWGLLFARGASYERLKNWPQAERDLQDALKLSSEQPEVLNYLGYLWLLRGKQVTQAKAMISRAMSQRPNDPQIMDSMGWAYYLTGEYGKATHMLERALNMVPSDPTVNEHLGDAYWQQGRKTEARFQWERSLMFSPEPGQVKIIEKKIKEGVKAPDFVSITPPIVASKRIAGQTTR